MWRVWAYYRHRIAAGKEWCADCVPTVRGVEHGKRMILEAIRLVEASQRVALERRLQSRIATILARQVRRFPVEKVLRDVGITEAHEEDMLWSFIYGQWPEESMSYAAQIANAASVAARVSGNLTLSVIGYRGSFTIGDAVRDRLATGALVAARSIDDTSRERIRAVMARGVMANRSSIAIARDIRTEMAGWPRWRAEMIARTEIAEAWESTRYEVLARNGVQAREWITAQDERVDGGNPSGPCISNAEAGPVDIDKPFPSGAFFPPAHPNCLVGDTRVVVPGDVLQDLSLPVSASVASGAVGRFATTAFANPLGNRGGISASTDRDYVGDVITIKLRNGYHLTGTPNHPIATRGGWVPLSVLQLGDDVLCSRQLQGENLGTDPDVENVPPTIQQVAESLPVTFSPMPTSTEDFHGDGSGSDIHVVRANGLFNRAGDSHLMQHALEEFVRGTDMRSVRFPTGSTMDELFLSKLSTPDSIVGGGSQSHSFFGGGVSHSDIHRLTASPWGNSVLQEDTPNSTAADTKGFCEQLFTLSPLISSSDIVWILRHPFSGHVYNLQTPSGWYIGNGIVTHNCRCDVVVPQGSGVPENAWTGGDGGRPIQMPQRGMMWR